MMFFIALLLHITPVVFLSFQIWILKDHIRLIALETLQNRPVSTVSLLNSTTDIIEIVLEPQILIPIIIGTIFIIILLIIVFVLCTTERSNAITRIIYSIRGAPKKEDKDITLNIQNDTSRSNNARLGRPNQSNTDAIRHNTVQATRPNMLQATRLNMLQATRPNMLQATRPNSVADKA
jgi:hypothetical protein